MDYVTATELSKIWNISSRMIAYYSEEGRIKGVAKKGKVWLIPANAQKPIDKRKTTGAIMAIDKNIAEKEILSILNKIEIDNADKTYYQGYLYKYFGLTRDTLRYYEKIGLIEPKRQIENSYREFDSQDTLHFMAIDL